MPEFESHAQVFVNDLFGDTMEDEAPDGEEAAYADAEGDQDEPAKKKTKPTAKATSATTIPPISEAPFFGTVKVLAWEKGSRQEGQAVAAFYPPHSTQGVASGTL